MSDPVLRIATRPEVDTILDWAAAEGWNPGLDDARAFHAADPRGVFVATVDDRPVAAISVVNHSARFAFLGLYICQPAHRGRGLGHLLWRHALRHAGGRTVGLDGVAAQQGNYAASGFVRCGRTLRLEGRLPPPDRDCPEAAGDDLARIVDLDGRVTGYPRPLFATEWVTGRATRRTVICGRDGTIDGFATARLCRRGCKIGPVVAPSVALALDLIKASAAAIGCAEASIDVPDSQTEVLGALGRLGFTETFATARMYRGPAPAAHPHGRAIATMELG